jgi:hypothetical protein
MENIENKLSISPNSFYEIIHEDGDLISYEQEKLDKLLDSIILEIKPTSKLEEETVEKIQKAVEITEDIISTMDRFVEDATLAEDNIFIGFHEDLQKDAKNSAMKTLDIAAKLRENNSLSLVPIIRDLTTRIEWIELILSKTSIEQMKNTLENRKTAVNRLDRLDMLNKPSTSNS